MKTKPTRLKELGFITKAAAGLGLSFMFIVLAVIIPLWPITTPLFLFLAVGAPFAFLGYRAEGNCPCCYEKIEVTKKYGGWKCKGCSSPLYVQNNKLYRI